MSQGVLITGGSSGIGFGIALAFVRSGANVLIAARDGTRLQAAKAALALEATPGQIVDAFQADITVPSQVEALILRASTELPQFNVLVANAGVGRIRPFLETSLEELREAVDLNFLGTFLCCREAAQAFLSSRVSNPSIVVVSSIRATGPRRGRTVYASTKAALNQMVKVAALELAENGIRVNAVAPGITETPLAVANGTLTNVGQTVPLGRAASVDDVSSAVLYLASPTASFITGVILTVDGGESLS